MTVYEMIQELSQFKADTEIKFSFKGNFDTDVDVDLEGEDNQTVEAEFDDYVDFDDIEDKERRFGEVVIQLTY